MFWTCCHRLLAQNFKHCFYTKPLLWPTRMARSCRPILIAIINKPARETIHWAEAIIGCIRFNPKRWFSAKVILVKQKIIKITLAKDHRLRFDIFEYASMSGIRPKQDWYLILKKYVDDLPKVHVVLVTSRMRITWQDWMLSRKKRDFFMLTCYTFVRC